MHLVCLSDNHMFFPDMEEYSGGVCIIAGDMTYSGTHNEFQQVHDWLKEKVVPHFAFTCIIGGNHDKGLNSSERLLFRSYITEAGAVYLEDQLIVVGGLRIYGTPWVPMIGSEPYWAFEADRGDEIAEKWKLIPENLDVLVCHTMPYKILDWEDKWNGRVNWGCYDLAHKLNTMKKPPKYFIGGHIHPDKSDQRYFVNDKTEFYNVAIMNNGYIPTWTPTIFEIK